MEKVKYPYVRSRVMGSLAVLADVEYQEQCWVRGEQRPLVGDAGPVAGEVMREGDQFAVPLPGGGWGIGVAARRGRGGVVLGYFSGRRFASVPSVAEATFSAREAVWVTLFGDLGVIEGRWRVLGPSARWVPDEWPLPDFGRFAELSGRHYRVSYNDDLRSRPTEILSTADEIAALPKDGLAAAGFVELQLDRILA